MFLCKSRIADVSFENNIFQFYDVSEVAREVCQLCFSCDPHVTLRACFFLSFWVTFFFLSKF